MSDVPQSHIRPARRPVWVWLIPLAALIFVIVLVIMYVIERGTMITLRLSEGHGIKAGDVVRCRGVVVGEVTEARLIDDLRSVELSVRLDADAEAIARAGSRFWVVRPMVGLSGIAGLETIAGPRYIAVIPGAGAGDDAPAQHQFTALPAPPVLEHAHADGLEVLLVADNRSGLVQGAPVLYRQMPIGKVLSVTLASDATSVEVRVYINPAFTMLVRDNSRFWDISGVRMELGVTGLQVDVETLESLIVGGVALATPDPPGKSVNTGHRFRLHAEARDEWLEWRPSLAVGAELLPAGVTPPTLLRAITRRTAGIFRTTRQSAGWLLPVEGGLLGPVPLLNAGDDPSATIEVAGQAYRLTERGVERRGMVTLLPMAVSTPPWPARRMRLMTTAEDLVLFTDSPAGSLPIASPRVRPIGDGVWQIDAAISLPEDMQGAAAVARSDGAVVGILSFADGRPLIVPIVSARIPAPSGAAKSGGG